MTTDEHFNLGENQPNAQHHEPFKGEQTGTEKSTVDSASTKSKLPEEPKRWSRSSLSIIDIDTFGKPAVVSRVYDNKTRTASPLTSDAIDYLPEEPPISNLPIGGVRIVLREDDQPAAWNIANRMTDDIYIEDGITKHILYSQAQRFSLRNLQALLNWNRASDTVLPWSLQALLSWNHASATVLPRNSASPSRVVETKTRSTFLLQAPISEYVLPKGAVIDASQGLHPLLSAEWHFSTMVDEGGIALHDGGALVRFQHRPDGRSVVFCSFPAMTSAQTQTETLSPMLRDFEDLFLSSDSALQLVDWTQGFRRTERDARRICRLALLDLMRAALGFWDSFGLAINTVDSKAEIKTDSATLQLLRDDVARSRQLVTITRDFGACLEFLLDSMDIPSGQIKTSFYQLAREVRTRSQSMQARMKDLAEQAAQNMAAYQVRLSEMENKNSKNLHRAVAVYLPLGLAASLVSMSAGIFNLGESWANWIDFSLVLITALFLFYIVISSVNQGDEVRNDTPRILEDLDTEKMKDALAYFCLFLIFFNTLPDMKFRHIWAAIAATGMILFFQYGKAKQIRGWSGWAGWVGRAGG